MATTPSKYQPSERLIDNPDRLYELYCSRDLSIREIAEQYAEVGRTRVSESLNEYGITDDECCEDDGERGIDPPSPRQTTRVSWSEVT